MHTLTLTLPPARRPRRAARAPDETAPRCARCGNPIPPLAARDGDVYCSAVCCKAAHGVREMTDADAVVIAGARLRLRRRRAGRTAEDAR